MSSTTRLLSKFRRLVMYFVTLLGFHEAPFISA